MSKEEQKNQEIQEWRRHPVTKKVFQYLRERIDELGQFEEHVCLSTDATADQVGTQVLLLMGRRMGIGEVLNYEG
jgi:hypothetical protein